MCMCIMNSSRRTERDLDTPERYPSEYMGFSTLHEPKSLRWLVIADSLAWLQSESDRSFSVIITRCRFNIIFKNLVPEQHQWRDWWHCI